MFVAEAGPIIEWTNGAGNEAVVEDIMLNTNVSLFIFIHCIERARGPLLLSSKIVLDVRWTVDYFRQNLRK